MFHSGGCGSCSKAGDPSDEMVCCSHPKVRRFSTGWEMETQPLSYAALIVCIQQPNLDRREGLFNTGRANERELIMRQPER